MPNVFKDLSFDPNPSSGGFHLMKMSQFDIIVMYFTYYVTLNLK